MSQDMQACCTLATFNLGTEFLHMHVDLINLHLWWVQLAGWSTGTVSCCRLQIEQILCGMQVNVNENMVDFQSLLTSLLTDNNRPTSNTNIMKVILYKNRILRSTCEILQCTELFVQVQLTGQPPNTDSRQPGHCKNNPMQNYIKQLNM